MAGVVRIYYTLIGRGLREYDPAGSSIEILTHTRTMNANSWSGGQVLAAIDARIAAWTGAAVRACTRAPLPPPAQTCAYCLVPRLGTCTTCSRPTIFMYGWVSLSNVCTCTHVYTIDAPVHARVY